MIVLNWTNFSLKMHKYLGKQNITETEAACNLLSSNYR